MIGNRHCHYLLARGEPQQAGLAGIQVNADHRIATCADIEITAQDLGRAPVVVFHQGQRDRVTLDKMPSIDLDKAAKIALVTVNVSTLYLQSPD